MESGQGKRAAGSKRPRDSRHGLRRLFDKTDSRACPKLHAVTLPRPFEQRVPLCGLTRDQILRRGRAVADRIGLCESEYLLDERVAVRRDSFDGCVGELGQVEGFWLEFFALSPPLLRDGLRP